MSRIILLLEWPLDKENSNEIIAFVLIVQNDEVGGKLRI